LITGFGPPLEGEGYISFLHTLNVKEQRNYIYHHDRVAEYGEISFWAAFCWYPNMWYTVTIRNVMNTFNGSSNADGIVEGFINGRKMITLDDIEMFEAEHDTMKIDGLHFSIFHNQEDVDGREYPTSYFLFDNIEIYNLDSTFAVNNGYAWGAGDTNDWNAQIYVPIDNPINTMTYDTIYTAISGTCKDKNGNSNYNDLTDEIQKIYVQNADSIYLYVNSVDVEGGFDVFMIIDAPNIKTANKIYYAKADIAEGIEYMITGENVILRLISDHNTVGSGFDIDYTAYGTTSTRYYPYLKGVKQSPKLDGAIQKFIKTD